MQNIAEFMLLWDYKSDSRSFYEHVIASPKSPKLSDSGNINDVGSAGSSDARVLTRQNKAFWTFVEANVKALLEQVVLKHNLISYSCCEGHYYKNRECGDLRNVAVLPRNKQEYQSILQTFGLICDSINREHLGSGVEMLLYLGSIEDNGQKFKVIELCFYRNHDINWDNYFERIGPVYEMVVRMLSDIPRISDQEVQDISLLQGKIAKT